MFFGQRFQPVQQANYGNQAAFAQMDRAEENRRRADLLGVANAAKDAWYTDEADTTPIADALREYGLMPEKAGAGAYDSGVSPGVRSAMDQSTLYKTDPGYVSPDVQSMMPQGPFDPNTVDLAPGVTEAAGAADAATATADAATTAASTPGIGPVGYLGAGVQLAQGAEPETAALNLAKKYLLSTLGPAGMVAGMFV
jgi:hypothetical protein